MRCFHPKMVPDPRYPDERVYISVPCRRCAACIQNRRNDWARRLVAESKLPGQHVFLTLTYAEEPDTFRKDHIQEYLQKIRKHYGKKIRYFFVGELGEQNGRIHYHALLFGLSSGCLDSLIHSWNYGFVSVSNVTQGRCGYAAKYCVKADGQYFFYASRKPALGAAILTEDYIHRRESNPVPYTLEKGYRTPIPRYIRRKLKDMDIYLTVDYSESNDRLLKELSRHPIRSAIEKSYLEEQQDEYTRQFYFRPTTKP